MESTSTSPKDATSKQPRLLNLRFQAGHVRIQFCLMLVQPCFAAGFWRRVTPAGVLIRQLLVRLNAIFPLIRHAFHFLFTAIFSHQRHAEHDISHMNELSNFGPLEAMNDTTFQHPKEGRSRPESLVDPHLLAGPNSSRRPPPSERLAASLTTRTSCDSIETSTSPMKLAHSRSISLADTARRSNRLSTNFPVLPPHSRPSRPPSWANSPVVSPIDATASTEGSFLTVLASQERRVLELKEELRQAEAELDGLKKHWANHEAMKKRGDVRRVQQLQPLSANLASLETTDDDVDGSSQWLHKEMERRKALLSGMKTSNRKVFSGSRHTRTLSLLSPQKPSFSQPFPPPADVRRPKKGSSRSPLLTRSSTAPGIAKAATQSSGDVMSQPDGTPSHDALLRTGKQMASDIKEGLWTFFEDIRQATVGDEATHCSDQARVGTQKQLTRSNTTSSLSNRRSPRTIRASTTAATRRDTRHDTLVDIGGSFWREHGVDSPRSKQITMSRKRSSSNTAPLGASPTESDEPWDNWGTPIKHVPIKSSSSDSSADSDQPDTPSDVQSTPLSSNEWQDSPTPSSGRTLTPRSFARTSMSGDVKRDSIPWPNLEKLTPSNLKRTASHLMKEWEKSLSPPASEHDVESILDYPLSSNSKVKHPD